MKESLELKEPLEVISPFVFDFETQALFLDDKVGNVSKKILAAFETLQDKDVVLVGGPHALYEGCLLGIKPPTLVKQMRARVLMIELWRGLLSADSIYCAHEFMGDSVVGAVINKVPENMYGHVKDRVKPFLEKRGIPVMGVISRDKVLSSVTVRQIVEVLNAGVICAEDRLDEFVENFLVGAMDVDAALGYFARTPNKAVITGAHRSDIQLAAMETSTKCIILTGGMDPNDLVLEKARSKGIPLIIAPGDTFSAVDKIDQILGRAIIREKRKAVRAAEVIAAEFDMKRFKEALGL
jgi:hypothetical protein